MMGFERTTGGMRTVRQSVVDWLALAILVAAMFSALMLCAGSAGADDPVQQTRIERWHDATPAERQEMRAAARDYWSHASADDRSRIRHRLRALRRALPEFSRMERRLLLRRMMEIPKTERRALRERLVGIEQLDADERAELETELRELIAEGTEDLHRMEENVRRWQNMTPEERDALREQARRFRRLPLEERERLLDEWAPADAGRETAPGAASQ